MTLTRRKGIRLGRRISELETPDLSFARKAIERFNRGPNDPRRSKTYMTETTEPRACGMHRKIPPRARLRLLATVALFVTGTAMYAQRVTYLGPSDGDFQDRFGYGVALHGSRAVVGAPNADHGEDQFDTGAAYIFDRSDTDGQWREVATLIPHDGTSYDSFGEAVAVWGSTVVIGSPDAEDDGVQVGGGVYVYERIGPPEDPWELTAKLISPNPVPGLKFGCAFAFEAEILAVGTCTGNGGNEGMYIYERTSVGPSTWSEPQEIRVDEEAIAFGRSLAIDRGRIAAGAMFADDTAQNAGAVLIFERDSDQQWSQVARLSSPRVSLYANVGTAVDLSGDTLVAGAPGHSGVQVNEGISVVFERDSETGEWHETARPGPLVSDQFGYFGDAVGVDGDFIVIGAPDYRAPDGTPAAGSVYVYRRDPNAPDGWRYIRKLESGDPDLFEDFGFSLAFEGGTLVVGDWLDDASGPGTGSITIFD